MERKNDGTAKHALLINNDDHESSSEMTEAALPEMSLNEESGSRCGSCYWISCGLGAGFCMGTGGAIYATCYARLGMAGVGITGPGTFIFFLIWRLTAELRHRFVHGQWLKPEGSRIVDDQGVTKWKNLIPLLGNVFINGMYLIVMSYAWNFAKIGGLNQGLVTTWLSVAAVYNVIVFYCVFKEKPLCLQYIGIVLIIAMIICLDLAAAGQGEEDEIAVEDNGYSKVANCTFALLLGAIAPILIASKCLIIRWYHNLGYIGSDLAIDANIIQYFIYSLIMIHLV